MNIHHTLLIELIRQRQQTVIDDASRWTGRVRSKRKARRASGSG